MAAPGPASPDPAGPRSPDARRERLIGLLVLGVAVVLLVSSVTWFASDRVTVGIGQVFLGWCSPRSAASSTADRRAPERPVPVPAVCTARREVPHSAHTHPRRTEKPR